MRRLAFLGLLFLGGCGCIYGLGFFVGSLRISHAEHEDAEAARKDGGP